MRRVVRFTMLGLLAGGLLAVSGTARTTGVEGVPAPAAFRLGDGSAGCVFDGERLACRAALFATAVALDSHGRSEPTDDEIVWDETAPVLRRTESWWHAGFSCAVEDDAIVCTKGRSSISVGASGFGAARSTLDE